MKKKSRIILFMFVLIAIAVGVFFISNQNSPYQRVVREGYSGTEEQLLASLVGELSIKGIIAEEDSAFWYAQTQGYRGSCEDWAEALIGIRTTGTGISLYEVLVDSGYNGGAEAWLESLVRTPENLGKSANPAVPTEYEQACTYGFKGSFVQWLLTLAGYTE